MGGAVEGIAARDDRSPAASRGSSDFSLCLRAVASGREASLRAGLQRGEGFLELLSRTALFKRAMPEEGPEDGSLREATCDSTGRP